MLYFRILLSVAKRAETLFYLFKKKKKRKKFTSKYVTPGTEVS